VPRLRSPEVFGVFLLAGEANSKSVSFGTCFLNLNTLIYINSNSLAYTTEVAAGQRDSDTDTMSRGPNARTNSSNIRG